jgi:hypothetical protein
VFGVSHHLDYVVPEFQVASPGASNVFLRILLLAAIPEKSAWSKRKNYVLVYIEEASSFQPEASSYMD